MRRSQMGRFRIDSVVLERSPDEIAELMYLLRFVAVRAEMLFCERVIEYVGISDRFRELKVGEGIAEYRVEAVKSEIGEVVEVMVEEKG